MSRSAHSGLVYLLAQRWMSEMVSLCYASTRYLYVVKFLQFLELAGSNMLALTNVAMAFNLALIIKVNIILVRSFYGEFFCIFPGGTTTHLFYTLNPLLWILESR